MMAKLEAAGFTFRVDEGRFLVSPASKLTDVQRSGLNRHRAEVLELLTIEQNGIEAIESGWRPFD